MLNVLDLFSGIGGFSLGLERTGGFKTAAFCEIDAKARQVLMKHWPKVPIFTDVTTLTKDRIESEIGQHIDVITGGFPCQDISLAGKGAGLAGQRSGLWYEYRRLINEIRPSWVIIENVSALRSRGLDVVLGGLAEIGYDAEWHCIPASAIGAPHRRDRIWVVAYPELVADRSQVERDEALGTDAAGSAGGSGGSGAGGGAGRMDPAEDVSDADSRGLEVGAQCDSQPILTRLETSFGHDADRLRDDVANGQCARLEGHAGDGEVSRKPVTHRPTGAEGLCGRADAAGWRTSEPDLGGMVDGIPPRLDRATVGWAFEPAVPRVTQRQKGHVDRLKQLGNAVVPQIPELIGRAILAKNCARTLA